MYIILKQDFPGLGQKDAIVQVKPGYGRNYLIPKGFAVVANASNRKVALENKRQIAYKVSKNREAAEAIVAQLDQIIITIPTKVIENSKKIFGSITATQIADILQTQHITIDPKTIHFQQPIKELGTHTAIIKLHTEVTYTLTFKVVAA